MAGSKQGERRGGRQKGTPNRRNAEVTAKAEASGLTPLDFMLQVLRDEGQSFDNRAWAAEKAAPYVHAKLSSVVHQGDPDRPVITEIVIRGVSANR